MQTLIYKNHPFHFHLHHLPFNFSFSRNNKAQNFIRIHPDKSIYILKNQSLCSATSHHSLDYGGWDDFQLNDDSIHSGESHQLNNFLNSLGIRDRKYVFVYLFGFVCALAISRVKIASIVVYPATAVVFALGFSVGLAKGGQMKESKLTGNKKKIIDETLSGFTEKLRNIGDNLNGYNAKIVNLQKDIRRSIECNRVTLGDLEGYIDVIESTDIDFINSINVVESCIQSIVGGGQDLEGGSDHDLSRRSKKLSEIENGSNFLQFFNVFSGSKLDDLKPGKTKGAKDQKQANILDSSLEDKFLNPLPNVNSENERESILSNPFDGTVRTQNRAENFVDGDRIQNIDVENRKKIPNRSNNTSRFVNSQLDYMEDYQDEVETMASHKESYDSVDLSIKLKHTKNSSSFGQDTNSFRSETIEEDQTEARQYSFRKETFSHEKQPSFVRRESSVLEDDLEFNNYLTEANNLLKEAKGCLSKQFDDDFSESALYKSAALLSKAIELRPMSLLAVGQLGNTYLLHGELKLNTSRELRSVLARKEPFSVKRLGKILNNYDDQIVDKNKITSILGDVCEECEELLVKAGRKYKLALSIDGNDMRALYNWGLALSFRAQLIADIGPSAARDADKVFLAAIDKFDAMMSKSNAYAPDALFRWGATLQHRSRLRPRKSREKVKLLQQARRLYEDALQMDSGNLQLQEALSSCDSDLDYWYR